MRKNKNNKLSLYHGKLVKVIFLLILLSILTDAVSQENKLQLIDSLLHELEVIPESKQILINIELSGLFGTLSFEKSLQHARKALEIAEITGDQKGRADAYNQIGITYSIFEIYDEGIKYFEEARNLRNAIFNRMGLAHTLGNLGIAYFHFGNREESLACFEEQVRISQELENDSLLAASYHNLGELQSYIGNLTESVFNLETALNFYKQIDNKKKVVEVLNILGDVYLRSEDRAKAMDRYGESRKVCTQMKFDKELAHVENQIGRIYLSSGNLNDAFSYITSSLNNALVTDAFATISDAYLSLSEYYQQSGDFQQAYNYHTKSSEFKDTHFQYQIEQKLLTLQTQYEIESKDQELEMLRRIEEIEELEIEKARYFRNFMIVVMTSFIIFSIISLYNLIQRRRSTSLLSRQKQLQEMTNLQLIESEKVQQNINLTKEKLFTVLTDDLMQPFASLLEYTELLERAVTEVNIKSVKKNSGIIYQSSRSLFQLLDNLLQWSRNHRGTIEFNPHYFDLNKTISHLISIVEISAHKKNIEVVRNLQEALIVYADEDLVNTIIRNLVNNAIKFTNIGGYVKIDLIEKNNVAEVWVTDNGVGISQKDQEKLFRIDTHITRLGTANERGTGLGLIIANELIIKNRGTISVESKKGKGTTFSFTLPKSPPESIKK